MDEKNLHAMRREPRPEFARELHERLRRQGPAVAPGRTWRPLQFGWSLAGGVAVALAVLCFTVPAVRVSAQAFLDLFRVRNFAAVSVDPSRFDRLKDQKLDLESLVAGGRPETLEDPGRPRVAGSALEAAAAAGYAVRVPSERPAGLVPDTVTVMGRGAVRFGVDTGRLRQVLEALDIRDITVPGGLEGQLVTVRTSPAVTQRFVSDRRRVELVQAPSPEVSLPVGLDLARFGEIGLRVAGLDAGEARRFARSIDWHSTLVVPVPLDASSFREVTIRGNRGLLVTFTGEAKSEPGRHGPRGPGCLLLWSEGDMVYALGGNLDDMRLVEMAESLR